MYFSIATLCLAVVLQTLVVNWDYVGGSRGAYIVRPREVPPFVSYGEYMFVVMLVLAILAVGIARAVEHLAHRPRACRRIRDNERAAEAVGVPTLRLKLVATTLCGALMGVAGAPLPYYSGYLNPEAAFSLAYAVNAIAMPLIGGAGTWAGPVIGAVLLGALQQAATVTISSAAQPLDRRLDAGGLRGARAARHPRLVPEAAVSGGDTDERAVLLRAEGVGKRFGGFVALQGIDIDAARRRAAGPDRPQRLRQEHLRQLRQRRLRRSTTGTVVAGGQSLDGLKPHRRARLGLARTFQLPQPFTSLSVLENVRVPVLFSGDGRQRHRARNGMPGAGGAGGQGGQAAARADAGGAAAARTRPRGRAEPAAADRGRGHGRALARRDRPDPGAAPAAQRRRHRGHHDRAHHARGDRVLGTPSGLRRRPQDRRG